MNLYIEKLKNWWNALPDNTRNLLVVGPLLFAILYFGLFRGLGGHGGYTTLFKHLDPEKASTAANYLDEKGINYKLLDGGTTILVSSSENVNRLRLRLAEQNITGDSSKNGDELLLGGGQFGMGDEQLRARKKLALERSLAKNIESYEQVDKAIVIITPAESSPFVREGTPAKASVNLKLKSGESLKPKQVKGISRIVANAVNNLKPENVVITDQVGNPLTSESDGALGQANQQLEYQASVERHLQEKAQKKLNEILGPSQAAVVVNAEVNFDEIITRRTEVSQEGRVKEVEDGITIETSRQPPLGGVPGTDSQIGERLPLLRRHTTGETRKEKRERVQYAIPKSQTIEKVRPGDIERLAVALTISEKVKRFASQDNEEDSYGSIFNKGEFMGWETRSQADIAKIESVVKQMVGFNEERGDTFSTEVLPFYSNREIPVVPIISRWAKYTQPQYLIPAILVAAIAAFVMHRLSKKNTEQRLREDLRLAEQPSVEVARTVQEVASMIVHNPEVVAQTLQNWLEEEEEAEQEYEPPAPVTEQVAPEPVRAQAQVTPPVAQTAPATRQAQRTPATTQFEPPQVEAVRAAPQAPRQQVTTAPPPPPQQEREVERVQAEQERVRAT